MDYDLEMILNAAAWRLFYELPGYASAAGILWAHAMCEEE